MRPCATLQSAETEKKYASGVEPHEQSLAWTTQRRSSDSSGASRSRYHASSPRYYCCRTGQGHDVRAGPRDTLRRLQNHCHGTPRTPVGRVQCLVQCRPPAAVTSGCSGWARISGPARRSRGASASPALHSTEWSWRRPGEPGWTACAQCPAQNTASGSQWLGEVAVPAAFMVSLHRWHRLYVSSSLAPS